MRWTNSASAAAYVKDCRGRSRCAKGNSIYKEGERIKKKKKGNTCGRSVNHGGIRLSCAVEVSRDKGKVEAGGDLIYIHVNSG